MDNQTNSTPQFGEYKVVRKIGCGGFGCVYLCKHPRFEDLVAVKTFAGNSESAKARQAFYQEARLLKKLEHPCIIHLKEVNIEHRDLAKNIPYLVMTFASHGSLRDLLEKRHHPFSVEEALPILLRIGTALQYAHRRRVIHRDIKPENILFDQQKQALLADFGIAVVLESNSTKYGDQAGTASYMAPEQFLGKSHRQSDQYALACVAYEMLTGNPPFRAPSRDALMYRHLHAVPASLCESISTIPQHVDRAILKALGKNYHRRYETIDAFLNALQTHPPERTRPVVAFMDDNFFSPRLPLRLQRDQLQFDDNRLFYSQEDEGDDFSLPIIPRRAEQPRIPDLRGNAPLRSREEGQQRHKRYQPFPNRAARSIQPRKVSPGRGQYVLFPDDDLDDVPLFPQERMNRQKDGFDRKRPQSPVRKQALQRSRDSKVVGTLLCCLALCMSSWVLNGQGGFSFWLLYGGLLCGGVYYLWLCVRCFRYRELGWGMLLSLALIGSVLLTFLYSLPLLFAFLLCFMSGCCYGWFHLPLRPVSPPSIVRRR